jgi:hypothetical protein
MIQSILTKLLHAHNQHEVWWFKVTIKPKADADASSPLDETPGKSCLSKWLGISMHNLWEILITWDLAKKRGKRGNILDWNGFQYIITNK